MKNNGKIIAVIVSFSFLASVAYSFYFQIAPAVDAAAYDKIAWNLVSGNGYKEDAGLSYNEDIAIVRVGPGYQFFLAGVYFVFGHNLRIIWIINAILHALSALFVYFLSKEVFKENPRPLLGLAAAALVGFSPDLITMSGMLMTETLGIFLAIFFAYLFFKYINSVKKPLWLILLSALAFGFAVMVRTPAALMILPVLYYFCVNNQWGRVLIFAAVLAALFSPWVIRNYKIYNTIIPTNYAFGYDLLVGNHPGATGELEQYGPAERYIREYSRIDGNKFALKDALSFISARPFEFIKITLHRISIYFSFVRPTGFWFHLEGLSRALTLLTSSLYSLVLFGFGFWGIFRVSSLAGEDKNRARMLFWLAFMMPVSVVGIIVETRYRFPVYPFFAVFAALGLWDIMECKGELRLNAMALFLVWGFFLANGAFDAFSNWGRVAERIKELL